MYVLKCLLLDVKGETERGRHMAAPLCEGLLKCDCFKKKKISVFIFSSFLRFLNGFCTVCVVVVLLCVCVLRGGGVMVGREEHTDR